MFIDRSFFLVLKYVLGKQLITTYRVFDKRMIYYSRTPDPELHINIRYDWQFREEGNIRYSQSHICT